MTAIAAALESKPLLILYYSPREDELFEAPPEISAPNPSYIRITPEHIGQPKSRPANTAFHPEQPNFQFAWDSTSLDLFRSCPRKYDLVMRQGWHDKTISPPLAFGIAVHKIFETWHFLTASDLSKPEALARCVMLAGLLGDVLPRGDTSRTKETLVRTTVWYVDHFWDDAAVTLVNPSGKPAAEFSFRIPIMELDGIEILYCGHIDRFASFQGDNYPSDYKSTGYALNTEFIDSFKPHGQFSGYNIAGKVLLPEGTAGIILDAFQLGVTYTRFQRAIISYSTEEVEEDIQDIQSHIRHAKQCADDNYWPKNPTACGRYFKTHERAIIDTGCPFRSVCSKPPGQRDLWLKRDFTQRTWDPLQERN